MCCHFCPSSPNYGYRNITLCSNSHLFFNASWNWRDKSTVGNILRLRFRNHLFFTFCSISISLTACWSIETGVGTKWGMLTHRLGENMLEPRIDMTTVKSYWYLLYWMLAYRLHTCLFKTKCYKVKLVCSSLKLCAYQYCLYITS